MPFVEVFGGTVIYPAQQSYLALSISTNVTLAWPVEQQIGGNVVADILDVTATTGGLTITLPDARQVSTGYTALINNVGGNTFTVADATGGVIVAPTSGTAWVVYLRSNATEAGLWRTFQMGAGTSSANAASLAGAGLKAITTTLNTMIEVSNKAVDYTVVDGDRAKAVVWTGGTGTFTLPDPTVVGSDWYVIARNSGTGSVTLSPSAGTIDSSASLILAVNESTFVASDGTNYFTIGLGQQVNSVFDFVSINVAGSGDYTLTGAELNRVSYRFTGLLTGARNVIVPASVQQYWVDNQTTGAFALQVKTAAGTGVTVAQSSRAILYCDGTNVVSAQTINNLTFADGSAASPSITFTAENIGLYRAGTNTLGFSTAATSRGTIDGNGTWNIPAVTGGSDYALKVNGAATNSRGAQIVTPAAMTATQPGLEVKSTAAGGAAVLSINADNGTLGTDDFAIVQNGATHAVQLVNRDGAVTAGIALVCGSSTILSASTSSVQLVLGSGAVANNIRINNQDSLTVGAAGGAAALPATPSGYWTVNINGANVKIPYYSA